MSTPPHLRWNSPGPQQGETLQSATWTEAIEAVFAELRNRNWTARKLYVYGETVRSMEAEVRQALTNWRGVPLERCARQQVYLECVEGSLALEMVVN